MNLLVVGANGLLGSNVISAGHERNWNVSGTYHSTAPDFEMPLTRFDLRNHDTFNELLDQHNPDVVVNCVAMTDVDACERNPEQAHHLNGETPGLLAKQCGERGTKFAHVSTDYVFSGEKQGPYVESADTNPLQVYGESKLAGERTVRRNSDDAIITRLSFVYGVHRSKRELSGFPAWVRTRFESNEEVPLFTDQWVTPTRAGQAAETLLDLVEEQATGLYHVACKTCISPYEFGEVIAEQRKDGTSLLVNGSMNDVDRAAERPARTCLSVEKVENRLGRPQPTLREDIAEIRDAL